jgi:hypothetical protein
VGLGVREGVERAEVEVEAVGVEVGEVEEVGVNVEDVEGVGV